MKPGQETPVTGTDLDIATMVAVSKGSILPQLAESPKMKAKIVNSVKTLENYLNAGHSVYGKSSLPASWDAFAIGALQAWD